MEKVKEVIIKEETHKSVQEESSMHLACPYCGSTDIIEEDVGIRWNRPEVEKDEDGHVTISWLLGDSGDWERDSVKCLSCDTYIEVPLEWTEEWV